MQQSEAHRDERVARMRALYAVNYVVASDVIAAARSRVCSTRLASVRWEVT